MKHFFLSIFLFLTFFSSQTEANTSNEPENNFEINQRIISNKSSFLVGKNNSIWEIFCFDLRSQTWSEWWNSIDVKIQEEFIWDSSFWQVGDAIEIENNNFNEIITDNLKEEDRSKYYSYPYLLINKNSNKGAFARAISFEALINKLLTSAEQQFAEEYNKGYNKGYNYGYSLGYSAGYYKGSHSAN